MRVLIADDNAMSRLTLRAQLKKWGYEVVEANDGDAAWAILSRADSPRLAILDWMMPGLDGIELCRRVRAQEQEPYLYVILLTGREGRDDVVAGLDAGADDYVTKPFDAQELRVRVRAGERICTLHEELVTARERLRYEATHDHLTGTWNRAAIVDALERERSKALRSGAHLAIAMFDFDHFKRVNDSYGHIAGDAVLREGIARVSSVMRTRDLLGRYGGEEFLAVLPGADAESAMALCERARSAVADEPIVTGEHRVHVTVSVGVAVWMGVRDPVELVDRVDAALYRAKRAGLNRSEVAPDAANDRQSFVEVMAGNR